MDIQDTKTTQAKNRKDRLSRRDALKLAWLALGGVVSLEVGGLAVAYAQPRLAEGEFGTLIQVGSVDEFPPGSVTHISNGRFYLARLEDGGFLAIYQRCTHLGCNVPWDQKEGAFICPCHNSHFSSKGELLSPPAPRPLDLFPVQIQDGIVSVDTGTIINREKFDAGQVVYP
jgi:cytochrome b6-f complex iron-sulfur subunit